ncbi:MAG: hypothetical protein GXP59_01200 [Deltaproteobacteria bacterium]|nr:hypothetical protein [Deltaproteobacteria bacterium]
MECERFKHLLKLWYTQVQEETLAPARMVDLMENHIAECSTCLMDPNSKKNIEKIITLVLPKDKLSPPSRSNRTVKPTIDGSGPGPGGMAVNDAGKTGDISSHGATDGTDAAKSHNDE